MAQKSHEHPKFDSPVERVAYIEELMSGLAYLPGKTEIELAQSWGLSRRTVGDYAMQASRFIKAQWDPDKLNATLMSRIQAIGADALTRREQVIDAMGNRHWVKKPDHKAALKACELAADMMGFRSKKLEVEHKYAEMSDGEIQQLVTKYLADAEPLALPEHVDVIEATAELVDTTVKR